MTVKIDGTNTVANPAFTGADTDTGLQCGTSELKLVTGGTARVTVDSSGRLSSEGTSAIVHKYTGASNPVLLGQYNSSGDASINNQADAPLLFATNNTEAMRILSDGTIRLASGCPGIDFSQIQTNASGMSSETLDSYEEGTWTADLQAATNNNGGFTFDGNTGTYIKIGKLCFISIFIRWSGHNRTGSQMQLTGLPFTEQTVNDRRGGFQVTYRNNAFTSLSNVHDLTLRTETNTTVARFQHGNGDGNAVTEMSASNFNTAGGNMMITGCYEVA